MKSRTFKCIVAVLSAAIAPTMAQSPDGRPSATLPLKGLLSVPLHSNATARSSAAPISKATVLIGGLDRAERPYDFATADYPGASFSLAFGNNARTVVGAFVFAPASSPVSAFTFKRGVYRTLVVPGATGSFATDINSSDQVVGAYADPPGTVHGFLHVEGAFTDIDFPGATHTQAIGLNDSTQVVGDYIAGELEHGFLYSGGVYTAIDYPGALHTAATSINSSGDIVGGWLDSTTVHGFLLQGGVFTSIDFPDAAATVVWGLNDGGELAGYYSDGTIVHGFVFSNGAFSTVDVDGAKHTQLTRINNTGQVAGVFLDVLDEAHGLTGRPASPAPDDD